MLAVLPLLLVAAPEVLAPEPLGREVQERSRAFFSMAHDDRGVMYFGLRGRIAAYDGQTSSPIPLPNTDRVLALAAEGARLWFGGGGDFGFVHISERAESKVVSLRGSVRAGSPIVQAALPLSDAVYFGTSDGWLFRCPRPVDARTRCTEQRVSDTGYTIFSAHGGRVWGQVQGAGLFRFDGDRFVPVSQLGPFSADRMTIDLPGRRQGERLFGFYRAGLFWWDGARLTRFKGPDDGFTKLYRGRRLPDGRYAVITYNQGLRLVAPEGGVESWRAPEVLDADTVFRIHVDGDGLLWVKTLRSLTVFAPQDSLRLYDLRTSGEEIKGMEQLGGEAFVLVPSALYRLDRGAGPAPGHLVRVAALRGGGVLKAVGDQLLIATDDGLMRLGEDGLQSVFQSPQSITDLATHPAHPELLFVGFVHGLAVLRRTPGGYAPVQTIPAHDEVIRMTFEDEDTLWFVEGSRRLRVLRRSGAQWALGDSELPQHPALPAWHYLGRDAEGLWVVRGRHGLFRRGASGRFQPDHRVSARLSLPFADTSIAQRPSNRDFLLAEHPTEGGARHVWLAKRTAEQSLHEADWKPYPPWVLGPVGQEHIFEAVVDGRFWLGGVGLVMTIGPEASHTRIPPRAPLIRRLEARSRTSTASRPLPNDGAHLAWEERGLLVAFSTPEHHPGARLEYRTRVLELGGQWSPWTSTRRHVFDALPDGRATVEVQARDEAGLTSPPRRVTMLVEPPWHRRGEVLAMSALLLFLAIAGTVALSTRQLRRRAARLARELVEREKSEALARGQTALLGRTLENLSERPQLDTFLQSILSSLRRELGAETVQLWVRNEDDDLEPHTTLPAEAAWRAPNTDDLDEVLEQADAVWLPLRAGGTSVGRIGLFAVSGLPLDEPRRYVAQALASQTTLAIELASLASVERELAVQTERASLSREVHDNLAQGFVITGLQMQRALDLADTEPEPATLRAQLEAAYEINREGLREARRLIRLLRWDAPEDTTLPELLEGLRRRVELLGLRFGLQVRGEASPLEPRVAFELFQIAHEAVANTLKHAKARQVSLTLELGPTVRLHIADDGVGYENTSSSADLGQGLGMKTMRERAAGIGARLETHSEGGTRVEVELPGSA